MYRKLSSRVLSFFLAMCMVLQIVPVFSNDKGITATAADATEKVLSFIDTMSKIKPGASYITDATFSNYGWEFDADKTSESLRGRVQTNAYDIHRLDGSGLVSIIHPTDELTIAFDIEKDGIYSVSGIIGSSGHYCPSNLTLKVDSTVVAVENLRVGSTGITWNTKEWGQVSLSAGRHYIYISNPNGNNTHENRLYLQKLKFVLSSGIKMLTFGSKSGKQEKITVATMADYGWQINENKTDANLLYRIKADTGISDHHIDSTGGYMRARILDGEQLAIDFEIPAAGVYGISADFFADGHYCAPNMQAYIDGVYIAKENMKTGGVGSYATKTGDWGKHYLTSGRHTIVFKNPGADANEYNYVQIKNIKFREVSQAKATNIAFKASGSSREKLTTPTLAVNGWELDTALSQSDIAYRSNIDEFVYSGYYYLSPDGFIHANLKDGEYMALRLKVETDGEYIIYTTLKDGVAGYIDDLEVYIDSMSSSAVLSDNLTQGIGDWDTKGLGTINLTAGEHVLYFSNPTDGTEDVFGETTQLSIKNISVAPAGKPAVETIVFNTTKEGNDTLIDTAVFDEHGWCFDMVNSDANIVGRVQNPGYATHYRLDKTNYLAASLLDGDRLALKFKVDGTDEYEIKANMFTGGVVAKNLTVNIDSVSNAAVANIDCTNGNETYVDVSLGSAVLSTGEHSIIFTNPGYLNEGDNFNTQRLYLKSITFTPKNPVTTNVVYTTDVTSVISQTGVTQTGVIPFEDLSGQEAIISDGIVSYEMEDESVAEFGLSYDAEGKLTYGIKGLKEGTTKAYVRAERKNQDGTYSAAEFVLRIIINAEGNYVAEDLVYDFRKINGADVKITEVTSFDFTTAGNADEINPDCEFVTAPWKFIFTDGNILKYQNEQNGVQLSKNTARASFGMRVKEGSAYQVISNNTIQPNGAKVSVYIAPEAAAEYVSDEYYVGTVDTYGENIKTGCVNTLGSVKLESGDYVLTYVMDGKNDAVAVEDVRFDFTSLVLKGIATDRILKIKAQMPDKIVAGDELEIPVSVVKTNGITDVETTAEITVKSSDNSVAELSVATDAQGGLVLSGTAKKAGNTVVTLTATDALGYIAAERIVMTVQGSAATASRTYKYVFKKALPNNTKVSEVDSYSKTLAGSPDELRPGSGTDPWKYYGTDADTFQHLSDDYGVYLGSYLNDYGAISVLLPESGYYRPVLDFKRQPDSGITRMYIAPIDAKNPIDDVYAVGDLDAYSNYSANDSENHVSGIFKACYLEAGEYVIAFKQVAANEKYLYPRIMLSGVNLEPITENDQKVTISSQGISSIEFKVGEYIQIPIEATISDISASDKRMYAYNFMHHAEYELLEGQNLVDTEIDAENGIVKISAIKEGTGTVKIGMNIKGRQECTLSIPVSVSGKANIADVQLELDGNAVFTRDVGTEKGKVNVVYYSDSGKFISKAGALALGAKTRLTTSNEKVAKIDNEGNFTYLAAGEVVVNCSVTVGENEKTAAINVTVNDSKRGSTLYTAERVAAARENSEIYSWAKNEKKEVIKTAEKYLKPGMTEMLWEMVTTQELPRSYHAGYRGDPDSKMAVCRYCNKSIVSETGNYVNYIFDPINSPWKIQCPLCRRKFPSNDFGAFYETGIDANGNWSYELAKERGSHLLKNELYPEKGPGWGVDDGYGYVTGKILPNGIPEVHAYISMYNHYGIWHRRDGTPGVIQEAATALSKAYMFTGDIKYGRVAAIILDRVADVYPDMDTNGFRQFMVEDMSYDPPGKVSDRIWENEICQAFMAAYDAVYDAYDDPYVVNFLSEKAQKYNMENKKETANQIRQNFEDNYLREIYRSVNNGNIGGNFGMCQSSSIYAGVILDTMPESQEMIDWAFRYDPNSNAHLARKVGGGSITVKTVNDIDRDGMPNEISPGYSNLWGLYLLNGINALSNYDRYESNNIYDNPKFAKTLYNMIDLSLSNGATAQIGDSASCGGSGFGWSLDSVQQAWMNTRDPIYAQLIYYTNGNTTDGLKYDIYTKNPESIKEDVQKIIDEYGECDTTSSTLMASYGFAGLRAGEKFKNGFSDNNAFNNKRNFWMHFGRTGVHSHQAALNIGVEAFGLNMAPEFGYPLATTGDRYLNFDLTTVAHNTVVVNDKVQGRNDAADGKILHFDDGGRVKVMDADATKHYTTDAPSRPAIPVPDLQEYRRTVVMVEGTDDLSYGVDFFRVKGGNKHVYSFHAMSDHLAKEPEGITMVPQTDDDGNYIGSYAGADIPFETPNITSGYSYLHTVDRAVNPQTGKFAIDFAITDFRETITKDEETPLFLRMSMLNEDPVEEVAIATGSPSPMSDNPQNLKFMLVRNDGDESLFTTVIEPYAGERYIKSIDYIPSASIYKNGAPITSDDVVKAVKVELVPNGEDARTDYIIYSLNGNREYVIKDGDVEIAFCGFVGVYTVDKNNQPIYKYINDGSKIGDLNTTASYSGHVTDFTKALVNENTITVKFNSLIDVDNIVGRYAYIYDDVEDEIEGYEIIGASQQQADGTVELFVGDDTTVETVDENGTYKHYFNNNSAVVIPLSASEDTSPVIESVEDGSVASGAKFTTTINASSPVDKNVILKAAALPRGASFDTVTGVISWVPDRNQIGENHFAITATDGTLETTIHFSVTVHKSALGSAGAGTGTGTGEGSGSGAGAGGGAAGGGAAGGGAAGGGGAGAGGDTTQPEDTKPEDTKPDDSTGTGDEGERFIDLGNHNWAKEAIYYLVEKGVINGTSANTYSPANNIKRADFAIMLTRAFKITEGDGEQFADVDANKYYAEELRLAKIAGIVNGVGNNNFNPEGEITRQDMMLMLYRALKAQGYELSEPDHSVLADFTDSALIADYAKDAVSVLIKDGIITGSNGRINPKAQATRAEIAVMLSRVIK